MVTYRGGGRLKAVLMATQVILIPWLITSSMAERLGEYLWRRWDRTLLITRSLMLSLVLLRKWLMRTIMNGSIEVEMNLLLWSWGKAWPQVGMMWHMSLMPFFIPNMAFIWIGECRRRMRLMMYFLVMDKWRWTMMGIWMPFLLVGRRRWGSMVGGNK